MQNNINSKLEHATCEVVVTRADGTVEKHGIVAEYHRPEPNTMHQRLLRLVRGRKRNG